MKIKYVLVCLTALAIIATAFAVNARRQAGAYARASANQIVQSNNESPGPIRNLRFTVFQEGIRPAQIRIQAGLVNIAIEDRTNDSEGLLIFRVEPGQRMAVGNVRKAQNHARGRAQFRFTSGTYELQDSARPSNKAVLIVEP